ncbi:MAG: protease-4 [Paraglaciecola sp.]|jgi:protease-4
MIKVKEEGLGAFTEKYVKRFYKMQIVKTAFIVIAILLVILKTGGNYVSSKFPSEHLAIINVTGTIEHGNPEGGGLILSESLRRAFEDDSAKAILMIMNSGGGSPVQAEMTFDVINSLKSKYDKEIIVSMGDVCASACYFISAAVDKIYAHHSTVTGSIGVRMDSWGLTQVIASVGVERRTITTGPHKAILDPFQVMTESDKEIVRINALIPMYNVFIGAVKQGRGEKITEKDDTKIYNGLFWTGEQAKNLGLVDELKATPLIIESLLTKHGIEDTKKYNGQRLSVTQLLTSSIKDIVKGITSEMNSTIYSASYN